MRGKTVTYFKAVRSPSSRWKLQKINGILLPFDESGSMEEFGVQIFASEP